jgi:hypothetical protein
MTLAASCGVLFMLFYPPTHAHLYSPLTCFAKYFLLLAFCGPLIYHVRAFTSVILLLFVSNISARVLFVCPCPMPPMRLLHVFPRSRLLAGDFWGLVNIHTHQVDQGEPPQCSLATVVMMSAASCELYFTLFYPPTHAHLYSSKSSSP